MRDGIAGRCAVCLNPFSDAIKNGDMPQFTCDCEHNSHTQVCSLECAKAFVSTRPRPGCLAQQEDCHPKESTVRPIPTSSMLWTVAGGVSFPCPCGDEVTAANWKDHQVTCPERLVPADGRPWMKSTCTCPKKPKKSIKHCSVCKFCGHHICPTCNVQCTPEKCTEMPRDSHDKKLQGNQEQVRRYNESSRSGKWPPPNDGAAGFRQLPIPNSYCDKELLASLVRFFSNGPSRSTLPEQVQAKLPWIDGDGSPPAICGDDSCYRCRHRCEGPRDLQRKFPLPCRSKYVALALKEMWDHPPWHQMLFFNGQKHITLGTNNLPYPVCVTLNSGVNTVKIGAYHRNFTPAAETTRLFVCISKTSARGQLGDQLVQTADVTIKGMAKCEKTVAINGKKSGVGYKIVLKLCSIAGGAYLQTLLLKSL